MVTFKRRLGLLLKLGRELFESEDTTEESEPELATADPETEPTMVYWEQEQKRLSSSNQPFIDIFLSGKGLDSIPDTTEEPVKESHFGFGKFFYKLSKNRDTQKLKLPETTETPNFSSSSFSSPFSTIGEQITTKPGTGISSSGHDAGVVAGIVIAVISGIIILAALIAVVMYKHYVHRNVTSMNFDNPVYRKTTEDQFALEKNGYAPGSKLYPSTVGEEAQEPLNTPGTNDFV